LPDFEGADIKPSYVLQINATLLPNIKIS